jgi:GT2 family glycosyltransferase
MRAHPIHMSSRVRYRLDAAYTGIYEFLVGGVLTIRPDLFKTINGFSNRYFNWGGEDDDMGLRLLAKEICVQRPITGFYYALSHHQQTRNQHRFELLFDAVIRQDTDGLSNIEQIARVTHIDEYPLVTWMTVKWNN